MKLIKKFNLPIKLALTALLAVFSFSSFAGIFSTKYDPYYGYQKYEKAKCIRPAYARLNNCCKVRSITNCKKVHSVSSFTKKELKDSRLPYQPMSALYVRWFR